MPERGVQTAGRPLLRPQSLSGSLLPLPRVHAAAAAAAKSLQPCPTLCDPIDGSPPGSSVHRILQARIPEWESASQATTAPNPEEGRQSVHPHFSDDTGETQDLPAEGTPRQASGCRQRSGGVGEPAEAWPAGKQVGAQHTGRGGAAQGEPGRRGPQAPPAPHLASPPHAVA